MNPKRSKQERHRLHMHAGPGNTSAGDCSGAAARREPPGACGALTLPYARAPRCSSRPRT